METIWKFPLKIENEFTIEMPINSKILYVDTQNNKPQLWAKVFSENSVITKTFEVFGTGHEIPRDGHRVHIGSFQMQSGALVFHLFEKL